MKIGVEIKIDVTKIDKEKLYQGAKGKYLTLTAWVDTEEEDQYGNNGMVTQATTKEEREQNIKGVILGNSKVFFKDASQQAPPQQQAPQQQAPQKQQGSGFNNFDNDEDPF